MFEVIVVRTKDGYRGQVSGYGKILWESEPFPSDVVTDTSEMDKLRRSYSTDRGSERAEVAARDKIVSVMEGLFA
jgi:hypothetical protein